MIKMIVIASTRMRLESTPQKLDKTCDTIKIMNIEEI
jgi:hypothetical protein